MYSINTVEFRTSDCYSRGSLKMKGTEKSSKSSDSCLGGQLDLGVFVQDDRILAKLEVLLIDGASQR